MHTTPDDTAQSWRDIADQLTPEQRAEISDAFDAVVAGWGEKLHCEGTTQAGARCRRLAHWRLNLHGCQHVLLCGHHLRAWERKAYATMGPYCVRCGGSWPTIADAYSVVEL